MNKERKGSAFVIVIGVLAVILFAATMFMSSTVDEGRQTQMSVRGLHSASLAEAALERAMRVLTDEINNVEPDKAKATDLGIMLRLPGTVQSGATLGLGGNLGSDELLNLHSDATREIVLTKDDLQLDGNTDLDDLVAFMGQEGVSDYEVTVKVTVEKAFRIAPGSQYGDFKVPGVDIAWNLRPDVKSFLNGDGYAPIQIAFPDNMSWLSFSVPIKIGPVTLININVANIIDKVMPPITIDGSPKSFNDLTSLHFFADQLINKIVAPGRNCYPINITFDNIDMPRSVSELWPSGVSVSSDFANQHLEKYGQLRLESEASITYKGGYISKRRVSAVKDFKVADCEPPAPMYSLFITNLANNYISFNNYGGRFIVNNMDLSGLFSSVKGIFTGNRELTDAELAAREVPGLIRVNYRDETDGDRPLVANVSMIGDWGAPTIKGDNDSSMMTTLKKIMGGIESFLILNTSTKMAMAAGKYNVNAEVTSRRPGSETSVPVDWTGGGDSGLPTPIFGGGANNFGLQYDNESTMTITKPLDYLSALAGAGKINLVPDVGKMSTNVIALAITLAVKPLVSAVVPSSLASVPDCFQKWDMAFMGTRNSLYTIPTTGTSVNKTSLFGAGGLHPTLTREIEGNLLKRYRRWHMTIVGLNPVDRLPLLPFPPVFVPPPPLVVPIWHTKEVLTKYDYELEPMKASSEAGRRDSQVHEYDPAFVENMPPNLYTIEQYAKKATYYYESNEAFMEDLPNRMTEVNGKQVFVLNGVSFISGSVGASEAPFNPDGSGEFNIIGRGMIVSSGNFYLGCNINVYDRSEEELSMFSLVLRNGALLVLQNNQKYVFEGSLYTDKGLYVMGDSSLNIKGNWVTNGFSKPAMRGTVQIDYVSSRVRSSFGSLHPERGKFDPQRYQVSFSPAWASWRAH